MSKMKTVGKVALTALFLYFIFLKVEIGEIRGAILSIKPIYFVLLIVISFLMITISCVKWRLFLFDRGIHVSLSRLIRYYLIGYFFNNILPSTIGGDLFRSYFLGRQIKSQSTSFGSVFMERLTGLIALLILSVVSLTLNPTLVRIPSILFSVLLMGAVLALIIFLFIIDDSRRIHSFLVKRIPYMDSVSEKIERAMTSVSCFKTNTRLLAYAMFYSFIFQIMAIINSLICCWALGAHPSVLNLAVIVPIIMLVSTLPITLGGLGLWEGSFAFFFSLVGLSPILAISVALILRFKNILMGIIGGVVFLFTRKKQNINIQVGPND